jgi:hypothetical protein
MRTALKEVAARSAKVMVVVIGSPYLRFCFILALKGNPGQ